MIPLYKHNSAIYHLKRDWNGWFNWYRNYKIVLIEIIELWIRVELHEKVK